MPRLGGSSFRQCVRPLVFSLGSSSMWPAWRAGITGDSGFMVCGSAYYCISPQRGDGPETQNPPEHADVAQSHEYSHVKPSSLHDPPNGGRTFGQRLPGAVNWTAAWHFAPGDDVRLHTRSLND